MKRFLVFLFAVAFAGQAWAEYFTIDNLTYYIFDAENHLVEVSKGPTEPTGSLEIPGEVTYPAENGIKYTVTTIYEYGFINCKGLTSITIGYGVTNIGMLAFNGCSNLKSINIPNSVTTIGEAVFCGCTNLTSISIPESIISIGKNAFSECNNLERASFASIESLCSIIFESASANPIRRYLYINNVKKTSITIPQGVTSIGDYAFYACDVNSITIGNDVTTIGKYAFNGCRATTITIPESVISIGEAAFLDCNCLNSITIPESITSISGRMFSNCALTSINIPNNISVIDMEAFWGCTHLTSVTIGSGVETIGTDAFKNCPIETLTYNSNIAGTKLDGLTTLETVNIGDAVTTISNGAFRNSTGLTAINVSADNDNFCSIDGVVFSKDQKTLIRCPAGKSGSYTIPDGVTTIGKYAFYGCKSLTSVTIPNSVTSIGSFAFYNCGLGSIIIPESVESIADNAFGSCLKLKSITIPGSVKSVGNSAFSMCVLESVIFEDGVASIGSSAFSNCKKLKSVTIPNSVTSIGENAFYECNKLESVTLPNNITSIKYATFSGCSSLPAINIPEGVTSIADYAFNGCSSFTSITIPGSVTSMSHGAFYGCSGLTAVCIPESVTSFGKYVFKNCTNLAGVCYEGSNVPEFGESMFDGDDGLNYVCVPATYMGESWGSKPIMKSGHQVTIEPATATCTEPGLSEGSYCSYCGKVFAVQQAVSAFGHSYSATIVAPTCTKIGYTTHTCSACNDTYNSDTVSAKGHKPDSVEFENIVPATCTAAGSKDSVVFCSVCQVEISREERAIPALGHTEVVNEAVAPTCTKAGKTEGKYCSVCSAVIKLPIAIPATGHTADSVEFENVVPATCTAAGSKDSVVFCSVCQDELLREKKVIPAKGHTIVIDEAVEPTCTKTGLGEGKHCSVCNEYEWTQELIPPLGHDFGKYVYNNDATLEADGTETATCSRCGEKDTRVAEGTKLNATAVSDAAASTLSVYAHHNTIVVENATDEIFVYNAMGTLIRRDVACRVRMVISATAPGIYIVKVGGTVKRVMVN
ncbi:MAG: leucine-rich repeat domain-containing protein [Salinivirgaceae bacterium]|nr:leucine-rich repeat domain-containing protein [Salinivirgaceae bacterium]